MNQYKGTFVALFLFCIVQLQAEAKPIVAVVKPVSESVGLHDTVNVHTSIVTVVEKNPNPGKKRLQSSYKGKKRTVAKIVKTTGDVLFVILEIAVYILEDSNYGCRNHHY